MKIKTQIDHEIEVSKLREQKTTAEKKYKSLFRVLEQMRRESEAVIRMKSIETHKITPVKGTASEAVAVVLASDWHIEENVDSKVVSGLNKFNMQIAKTRADKFFATAVRMTHIFGKDISINTMVLWLGGDFISNDIHDELVEINEVSPIEAIMKAQEMIASGIEYILKNSKLNLVIPCSRGNHSRVTQKTRFSTESGHSLETLMYYNLQQRFKGEARIKFIISDSYHTYVEVFGYQLRFHHGHSVKYGGGIGGIFIPAFKAISQWNKAIKADYDFFGHFHSMKDGGNFIGNGSLIGYNAYALTIKADYDKPKQAYVLIDKARGKTLVCPIVLD